VLCKIWGFYGSDYEECPLLGYKNAVRTSQETHYFSATEHSRLVLCKIWGFRGRDYEECRLLEYKNPVRISRQTHCVSATDPSSLLLCKIWGFHGGDYEECRRVALVSYLLVTGNVVPSSFFLSPWMDAMLSSETSVFTRATRRNIPEDGILRGVAPPFLSLWLEQDEWSVHPQEGSCVTRWIRNSVGPRVSPSNGV
jgi:hypothetical protein